MQIGRGIQDTWRDTLQSIKYQTRSTLDSLKGLGSGFANLGRSAFQEIKIWGSGLGIGVGYGVGQWSPGIKESYNSYRDVFKMATRYGIDLFNDNRTPKLQIVYKPIVGTPVLHTYIRISSLPGYEGTWGFNPNPFSSKVLLGESVRGIIKADRGWFTLPVTISRDLGAIRQVYNIATTQAKASSVPNYILYGPSTFNCYTWRNQILEEAGMDINLD